MFILITCFPSDGLLAYAVCLLPPQRQLQPPAHLAHPPWGPARGRGHLAEGCLECRPICAQMHPHPRSCPMSLPQDHSPGNGVAHRKTSPGPLITPTGAQWSFRELNCVGHGPRGRCGGGPSLPSLNHQVLPSVSLPWKLECHLPFAPPPLALHQEPPSLRPTSTPSP